MTEERQALSLRELADRLGLSVEAARGRAKRAIRAGKWAEQPRNHPGAPMVVLVPFGDLDIHTTRQVLAHTPHTPYIHPTHPPKKEVGESEGVSVLRDLLAAHQKQITDLTERLIRSEAEAAGSAAREIALGSLNDRLNIEVERLQADLDSLRKRGFLERLLNR